MLPWQPLSGFQWGYNFSCVIASDMLFNSRGGFLGTSYPVKTSEIKGVKDVAMETSFGTTLAANGF